MGIKSKRQKRKLGRSIFWCLCTVLFLFLSVGTIFLSIHIGTGYELELPQEYYAGERFRITPRFFVYDFEDRANRVGKMLEVTEEVYAQRTSRYVTLSQIPKGMQDAFVAIEDKRFYRHHGVDWLRTLSAGFHYLFGGGRFGGSTLTQQLVKNLTGHDEVTPSRKLQEMLYAIDLERRMDKSQILELYLNVIHFSDNCDGIYAASRHYFSKEPGELTVAECASIAAITNNPSYYNPIRYPEHNLARRNLILSEMLAQGYLSKEEYQDAVSESLTLSVEPATDGVNSWYTDMVLEDVITDLARERGMSRAAATRLVYHGGVTIHMAMDPELQALVEEHYRTAVRVPQNDAGVSAQSSIILIDSRTGDILGVAGAVGEKSGNRLQNFATETRRPPGSTIKPLSVYAPALEEGVIHWGSVYDDVPLSFSEGLPPWPKNADGVYRGLTNIAYAVAHSTNTVAVQVLEQLGHEKAYRYAKERFHLSGLVKEGSVDDSGTAALALGQLNYGVTLRELTAAYTAFADAGVYHAPISYYRVLDSGGRILLSNTGSAEVAISAETAAIMTKLLQGVIQSGTSSSVTLSRLCECAGKTGTTNADGDRWFIGYTPDTVCGVWCGYEYPEPLVGRNLCTSVWNQVMQEVVRLRGGRREFEVPSTVISAEYCRDSGCIMGEACALDPRGNRRESGWFLRGSQPMHVCSTHVLCTYDQDGGVSHGGCPEGAVTPVGLLDVERHFPREVTVRDAQYVWRGDPTILPVNPESGKAYFEAGLPDFCGHSPTDRPFNRSCLLHPAGEWVGEWQLPRVFWEDEE